MVSSRIDMIFAHISESIKMSNTCKFGVDLTISCGDMHVGSSAMCIREFCTRSRRDNLGLYRVESPDVARIRQNRSTDL